MDAKSEFKIGDRVWLLCAGWNYATVIKLEPLSIKCNNSEKSLKVPESQQQWLAPYVEYPMPKPGDTIKINDKHFVCSGMEFTIQEVQDGGWIKTTDGNLFHFDCFGVWESEI